MSLSKIIITFNEDLIVNSTLTFNIGNDNYPGLEIALDETWKSIRAASQQVTTGTPTINPGERSAINFVIAFNLDFGGTGFTVSRALNVVTIICPETYLWFSGGLAMYDYDTVANVDFIIENYASFGFSIDTIGFSQATNPCTHVLVTVETSELTTKITSPVSVDPNTENPFSFEWLRGTSFPLLIEDADGNSINELVDTPDILSVNNFTLQINNSPNGATVTVSNINTFGLDLEYSLDGITWQTSNTFSGLPADDYTLRVRDQYGCSFMKDFNVDEFGIYVPFFEISKSNSFRFANRITWGDSANYKNDENTLSCEVDVLLPYLEKQLFQSADVITTQFKSNYALNVATVVKENGVEVNVPTVKKTDNIGIKDKRDARKYNLGNGKTGIYFLAGNVYDYVSGAVTGTHALNGLLPQWGVSGNYISIAGSWFLIEEIFYDEIKNADVIVFTDTYTYTGPEVAVIVSTIFNRFNYEVYEFTIDMNMYIDELFRVRIVATDPHFTTVTLLSEKIWCKVKHDQVLEIHYFNNTNTDILYSTGIQHKIRIPYLSVKGKSEGNSETHRTDTTAILLDANLYEADEIQFQPVTKEIWRKTMIALSHENVWINGVGYVKSGDFNTEGPLNDTNLYLLTAVMTKTGNVYNSETTGATDFDSGLVQIPGLLQTDGGFVKY